MNRRMIFNAVGMMLRVEAALLLLPAITSAIYRESEAFAFLSAAVLGYAIGILPKFTSVFAKHGIKIIFIALRQFPYGKYT